MIDLNDVDFNDSLAHDLKLSTQCPPSEES